MERAAIVGVADYEDEAQLETIGMRMRATARVADDPQRGERAHLPDHGLVRQRRAAPRHQARPRGPGPRPDRAAGLRAGLPPGEGNYSMMIMTIRRRGRARRRRKRRRKRRRRRRRRRSSRRRRRRRMRRRRRPEGFAVSKSRR